MKNDYIIDGTYDFDRGPADTKTVKFTIGDLKAEIARFKKTEEYEDGCPKYACLKVPKETQEALDLVADLSFYFSVRFEKGRWRVTGVWLVDSIGFSGATVLDAVCGWLFAQLACNRISD